ncbi:MAG: hypothetical protein FRX49_08785 [Trebouxia sp. A1-2]|nr:MAG: hypothetical protein FRX49_08785 [Trebouxia sp. A1-2]
MEKASRTNVDHLKELLRREEMKVQQKEDRMRGNRLRQIALTPAKSDPEGDTSESSSSGVRAASGVGSAAPQKEKIYRSSQAPSNWQDILEGGNPKILPLMQRTLLPTGHPPCTRYSSADPALFCLNQTTIKVCKNNLKETKATIDVKVGNKVVTIYRRFEGHPEGAKAIKQAKDHVFSELTDTHFKDVLRQNTGLLSLYFRENVQNALKKDKQKHTQSNKSTPEQSDTEDSNSDKAHNLKTAEQQVDHEASAPAGTANVTEPNPAPESQAGRGKRKLKKTPKALAQQATCEEASDSQHSAPDEAGPSTSNKRRRKKDKALPKMTEAQREAATQAVLDQAGQQSTEQRPKRSKKRRA